MSGLSSLRETYESLNLEPKPIRPHILAAATVVFGDDYYAACARPSTSPDSSS
ncbi:DUF6004 family protein [Actinoallomurus acanthiterrae]